MRLSVLLLALMLAEGVVGLSWGQKRTRPVRSKNSRSVVDSLVRLERSIHSVESIAPKKVRFPEGLIKSAGPLSVPNKVIAPVERNSAPATRMSTSESVTGESTAPADRRGESTRGESTDKNAIDSLVVLSSMSAMAPALPLSEHNIIGSYYVELSFNKTVSIIFNSPVRSVDLGSRDIIADKASDVENILKVKSTKLGFNETNFSVITADGTFYSFIANYNEYTPMLAINLAAKTSELQPGNVSIDSRIQPVNGLDKRDGVIQFSGVRATQSDVVYNCDRLMRKRRNVRHVGVEVNQMEASIRGIYIQENVVYYKLSLTNRSNINYDIDYVRFFVKDKATGRSDSRQEIEVHPFYVYNDDIKVVRGKNSVERVYAFPKFTIPDNKQVVIETGETNGGRVLSFILRNSDIMGADLF